MLAARLQSSPPHDPQPSPLHRQPLARPRGGQDTYNRNRATVRRRLEGKEVNKPQFYECGICGCWHNVEWNGDCRQDDARFSPDDLDEKYGPLGWDSVDMPD